MSTSVLCVCSCAGGLLLGYDLGLVPGMIMHVREEMTLNHNWQQIVVSSTVACAAVGSLLAMVLSRSTGRRNTVAFAALCFLIGVVTLLFTAGIKHLIVGRCIQGLAIGIASATIPGLISDLALDKRRGVLLSLFPMCFVTGQFVSAVVAACGNQYNIGWRSWFGVEFGPAILLLSTCVFGMRPDSTKSTCSCVSSKSRLCTKQGCDGQTQSKATDTPLSLCHTPGLARLLFIGCLVHAMQQFSGINTVMFYTATVLEAAGVDDRTCALWLSCIPLGVNLLVMAAALPLVDLCGRRPLFLGSVSGVLLCLLCLSVGFYLHDQHLTDHVPVLVALSLYLVCYSAGLSGLPWTITAELFPPEHKALCVAVASGVNWGCNLLTSLTFLTLFDTIGKPGTYLVYAGLTALGLCVASCALPETRDDTDRHRRMTGALTVTVSKQPLLLSANDPDQTQAKEEVNELRLMSDPRLRPSVLVTDEEEEPVSYVLV